MKNLLYILIFTTLQVNAQSKLGINTSEPTHELDVNGTMRVRNLANTKSRLVLKAPFYNNYYVTLLVYHWSTALSKHWLFYAGNF